ncbi:MAG: hypothetical protein AAF513_06490 [Pseudomonadota bacterium]
MHNVNKTDSDQLVELTEQELLLVSGAGASVEWGTSTAVGAALVVGAATVASPAIAGAMAVGAVAAAGMGVYYALRDDDKKSGQ